MSAFNKVWAFAQAVAEKQHNLSTDTLKIALSNTAIDPSTAAQLGDVTQIAAGNGYTAGGATVAATSGSQTGGVYTLVGDDVQFLAAGGDIGTFRFVVLYNSANSLLIGYWDYGSSVDITDGNSFTVDLDQINGILKLT